MATKQQIFEKIGVLLDDVNDQMQALGQEEDEDALKVDLFEATVNYFAAHVGIYNKLLKEEAKQLAGAVDADATASHSEDRLDEHTDVQPVHGEETQGDEDNEEIVFTPESALADAGHASETESLQSVVSEEPEADHPDEDEVVQSDADTAPETSVAEDSNEAESVIAEPVIAEAVGEEPVANQDVADITAEAVTDNQHENATQVVAEDEDARAAVPDSVGTPQETDELRRSEAADAQDPAALSHQVTIAEKAFTATEEDLSDTAEEKPKRPLSINEIMSAQRKTGTNPILGAQRGEGTISDLKTAISLNDKLLFIKDLFNGYSLAYSEAIELLNRYDDFASAEAFLKTNYAAKNNWAEKPATVDKLYTIMRKRFGS